MKSINLIISSFSTFVKHRLVLAVALGVLAGLGVIGSLYYRVATQARIDETRPVDAIIVLGCAVWPGERASPALAARVRHAVELYRAGYAEHLVLTGGLGKNPPTEAEAMRRLAVAAGIPADALVLEETSHSTEQNLANAQRLMQARGWQTALLVSDPFHMLRAKIIARDLGLTAYGAPAFDSPNQTAVGLRVQYTARESLALLWYYGRQTFGEPTWLYSMLKGRI